MPSGKQGKELEGFVKQVQALPLELRSRMRRLKEMDEKTEALQDALKRKIEGEMKKKLAGKGAEGEDDGDFIKADVEAVVAAAEKKVAMAAETYQAVDGHVQQLDKTLIALEKDIKDTAKKWGLEAEAGLKRKASFLGLDLDLVKDLGGDAPTGNKFDMPVDPNEPTYCYCNRVSYGEMVGCENQDCAIGWFHIACVGLTLETIPKGKWYCPDCRKNRRR